MTKLLSKLLKPKTIDEVVGQSHLIGKEKIIRKMVETNNIFSLIFFGLPGIGKTTLANAICNQMNLPFASFNPTFNKKSDLEKILNEQLKASDNKFVLIIDEIHRMNKDKQDILLSFLEDDKLIVIGTTTENPYFCLNPAIRSRMQIFELKPPSKEEILDYLQNVCKQNEINLNEKQLDLIINNSQGDLRSALNTIDIISKIYKNNIPNDEEIRTLFGINSFSASSYGNEYYNLLSAFHKSLRGSDIDASLYYLARLIKIGDLQSITRRLIAMAYEDIGLANPNLISQVIMATNSAERLGFPEANQILATITIEICLSPKSNSAYKAINNVLNDIEFNGVGSYDIPNHLKDTHYKSSIKLGYGNYKYPHDYKNNWVDQQYLPNEMKNKKYYTPSHNEIEIKMNKILSDRKAKND